VIPRPSSTQQQRSKSLQMRAAEPADASSAALVAQAFRPEGLELVSASAKPRLRDSGIAFFLGQLEARSKSLIPKGVSYNKPIATARMTTKRPDPKHSDWASQCFLKRGALTPSAGA
jgi:hypothetical protein